ncbi:DNA-formamidopyrimidine glycosylase [Melissococcus plutonius]|uniref:DNA-formamidopyrimidine glycosylase n=1 Tax=Melissococcus plutonius TaxID=33970 RepID=UPI003C2B6CFF
MPELPEVETVRKGLTQLVVGKTICEVAVLWSRIIEQPEVETFQKQLIGQKIKRIDRRGKFLIFKLTNWDLISHLRMEGKYETHQKDAPITKHTHVIFTFSDDSQLRYLDVRKFGRMALIPKDKSNEYKGIALLGPEPTLETFHVEEFQKNLAKYHKAIKPLLLEQKLVTGLGNIYVDEALWTAKIHPEKPANTLSVSEVNRLHKAIIDILTQAVKAGGTTIRSYLNALGEAGTFQLALNVYGQKDKPCACCATPIQKIKVAQRGTHFCPHCQKL